MYNIMHFGGIALGAISGALMMSFYGLGALGLMVLAQVAVGLAIAGRL